MTTELEAREIWQAIESFQKKDSDSIVVQQKIESDKRRDDAIAYIATLDLEIKSKTTTDQKTECYDLMDSLRADMTDKDGETRQELQKKIDELLIQANQLKDMQRLEKSVEPLKADKPWWKFW